MGIIERMSDMPRIKMDTEFPAETPVTTSETAHHAKEIPADQTTVVGTSPTTSEKGSSAMHKKMPLIIAAAAIILGIGTGYGAQQLAARSGVGPSIGGGPAPVAQVAGDVIHNGQVFGVPDEKTFKDSAEGYLEIGGLQGEGSHKLLRPGGASQTVYLTSSITDLDDFDGMEVRVWGETFKGQTAGWLMDVGRVEVINTQATPPTEE